MVVNAIGIAYLILMIASAWYAWRTNTNRKEKSHGMDH